MTCLLVIHYWLIGDRASNVSPVCALDSNNVRYISNGNKVRNKMNSFMRIVEKEARKKVVWLEKKSDWDYRSVTQMWDAIKDDFVRSTEKLKGRQRLNVFLSMQTCCR